MLDHHHKIIFIHTPKAAGSSIEAFFVNRIGLEWDNRAALLIRGNKNPAVGPPQLTHLPAQEYVSRKHIPQSMFDEYYKFSFVRNPWSRLVSMYKYFSLSYQMDFESFVESYSPNGFWKFFHYFVRPQADLVYDDKDNLLVDFVGRFENLQNDFNKVCNDLQIEPAPLVHQNKSNPGELLPYYKQRSNKLRVAAQKILKRKTVDQRNFKTYQEYYNDKTIKLVADIYARDIEMFDYSFE